MPDENDTPAIAGKNAIVENVQLKAKVQEMQVQLDTAIKSLAKANDTLEQQERAKMIPVIRANTTLADADVMAMDTKAMFDLVETLRSVKLPATRGVSVRAGDVLPEEAVANFTTPNRFRFGPKEAK